jgi:hypothetical protein
VGKRGRSAEPGDWRNLAPLPHGSQASPSPSPSCAACRAASRLGCTYTLPAMRDRTGRIRGGCAGRGLGLR